jgi:hypothetical protein
MPMLVKQRRPLLKKVTKKTDQNLYCLEGRTDDVVWGGRMERREKANGQQPDAAGTILKSLDLVST